MKRREFLGLTGLTGAGLLLTACGSGLKTAPGTVSFYNDNPTWKPGYQAASDQIKKLTGIGLDMVSVPSINSYEQVIKSQLQTSKSPDLLKWWNGYRLQDLARIGQLAPLTEVWDAAAKSQSIDDQIKPDFSYDNEVYGLPLHESYYVVFYNKKIFDKYDLAPPQTWDELLSVAGRIKKAGITPFVSTQVFPWSFVWLQELISKTDPDFYQKLTAGEASYTDPTMHQVFGLWKELIEREYFTKPDLDLANAPSMLHAGSVAMYPCGTWNNQAIQAVGLKSGKDFDAFILPTVEKSTKKSVIVEAASFVVPAKAQHKADAKKAMSAWLDPQVQRKWTDFLIDSSPNPKVHSQDPTIRHVESIVRETDPMRLNRYWESSPPVLIEGNVQDVGDFMIHPNKADSVLSKMQKRADTEWDYWRKEVS
ncbi:MAG TPA: extracellular solute-binding protein [Mycobacteriales bacterium]|nr:extracellular solute-binding protein [Mycobacteriales bacterium]